MPARGVRQGRPKQHTHRHTHKKASFLSRFVAWSVGVVFFSGSDRARHFSLFFSPPRSTLAFYGAGCGPVRFHFPPPPRGRDSPTSLAAAARRVCTFFGVSVCVCVCHRQSMADPVATRAGSFRLRLALARERTSRGFGEVASAVGHGRKIANRQSPMAAFR